MAKAGLMPAAVRLALGASEDSAEIAMKILKFTSNHFGSEQWLGKSMELNPTPPLQSSFGPLADSLCSGVRWLETRLDDLGDQGPIALEFMLEAADNLRLRLEPEKVAPGTDIPASVRIRKVRHDFRNLIAAVVGFAELLLLEDHLLGDIEVRLRTLKRESLEFCHLLDQVRDSAA